MRAVAPIPALTLEVERLVVATDRERAVVFVVDSDNGSLERRDRLSASLGLDSEGLLEVSSSLVLILSSSSLWTVREEEIDGRVSSTVS